MKNFSGTAARIGLLSAFNMILSEGEPCSSAGQISTCFSDGRQEHPAALFPEHRRQIRVRVVDFWC